MEIGAAFKKPFSNITALVIGIILSIIPIVNILTLPGFLVRVANKTMQKDNSMPGWNNFGEIIVDSIKYIVIEIVYLIPAIIVGLIAIASIITQLMPAILSGNAAQLANTILPAIISGGALIILAVILVIIGAIMIVSGTMNFAKTKQFGAAFRVGEVIKNFFRLKFIVGLIVAVIIAIVISFILGLLLVIPLLGLIIQFIVMFPLSVIYISILADSYA